MPDLHIAPLGEHEGLVAALACRLESQWPERYGPGGVDARADLAGCCRRDGIPSALVALEDETPCGLCALRPRSIASHVRLAPWLTTLYVAPEHRGRGIGRELVRAVEARARALGFDGLYAAAGEAAGLFRLLGWDSFERVVHEGEILTLFRRPLRAPEDDAWYWASQRGG